MPSKKAKVAAIIPARWGSTRFPGKPLHLIAGKPLIQHVWERCLEAKRLDEVVIATDDMRIAEAAFNFGAEVAMTSEKHRSGTDRIAEVAKKMKDITHVLNVQGDEPLVPTALLRAFAGFCGAAPDLGVATVACPVGQGALLDEPAIVKLVVDRHGRALYFSRAAIPFCRDGRPAANGASGTGFLRHIGLYGYANATLQALASAAPCELEQLEKLEQLRALWLGMPIDVMRWPDAPPPGIDTPDDVARVVSLLKRQTHDATEPY